MKKQENFKETVRLNSRLISHLGHITGFGISLITPMFLLVWGAMWLREHFGVGDWAMVLAIVCGLISGGMTFYNFVSVELRRAKRETEEYLHALEERKRNGGDHET